MKFIFFSLLFILGTSICFSQNNNTQKLEGRILNYGKPVEPLLRFCGKEIKPESMLILRVNSRQEVQIYMESRIHSEYFQSEIVPLLQKNKKPIVLVELLKCPENKDELNPLLILKTVTLISGE